MVEWLLNNPNALWWIAGASVITFLVFLIAVPWLAVRIPADYFLQRRFHQKLWASRHPALRMALLIGKNLLGCLFIVAGLAMLLLPGQGILTILAGVVLLDFPGKYRLVRWIVGRPQVLRTINWLRLKAERPPLFLEE
jgi:hypothetical protein